MTMNSDWVIRAEIGGESRYFTADSLPILVGADTQSDIRLQGVSGSVQIGVLEGAFFVQAGRETRNLRVDGELVRGSRRLNGNEAIALDSARLRCRLDDERLAITIEGQITGGDTAPPDLDELARESDDFGAVEIKPISFRPAASAAPGEGRRRASAAGIGVTAAFGVLAVLGWFAFTAKSVEITVTPVPEELRLRGTLLKLKLTDRFLLRSGQHRVEATLAGYYPLGTTIEVGPAPDQSIELELERLPGLITLATEPAVGAEVRLDGDWLGTTPLQDVEIRPGRHRLEFVAERFLAEVRELDVTGGGERQSLNVVLTPSWAPVSFSSEPAGAEVLVDGRALGVTPIELELTAGERDVELRLRGYNAWRDTLVVYADQPEVVPPVRLTQADGRVELITDPAGAVVSVNGEFRGQTPLTLHLDPGRQHSINLSKPGYEPVTETLSVAADSGRRLSLDLVARLGVVDISSEPPGAQVWVDGERAGTTPQQLTLTALPHRLELRQDGYASVSTELTPRPGFPQAWAAVLERQDSLSGSGYRASIETSLGQALRLVLPGEFTMGSSRREQGRRTNEVLRPVRLSRAFYLGVTEVSNAQFRAFKPDHDSGDFSGVSLNEDEQPVVRVSWEEIVEYLNWLSIRDGLQPVYEEANGAWTAVRPLRSGYRLPTEAEWAWAARFAEQDEPLVFPWGAELPPPDRFGNFADLSAAQLLPTTLVTFNDGFAVSAPAGSFAANAVGIFDLGGNVAEWVQDYYEIGRSVTDEVAVDPLGPESGRFRVVRGSSWRSATVTDLRSAARNYSAEAREDVGFRVARNLE
jgi:formylglycine-generating enzyme required for sulfatase activity